MAAVDAAQVMGTLIGGKYRVEGSLGAGGMGAVWAVVEEATGLRMALKRLDPAVAAKYPHTTGLFEREYHVLKQLSHPCIVQAYDYGVDSEGPFYTMEALDGDGLIALAPMEWRGVCKLIRDVGSSLAILHSRRLLHRDVNHRNVRYDEEGRAKLLDFGALTGFGVPANIVGMAPFMPPEAVRRQAMLPNSDIYSLGCLAYWALTRTHPYRVKHARDLEAVWRIQLPSPSSIVTDIPAALDELVMSMLCLNPIGRPQTAREVIERVVDFADLPPGDPLNVASGYLRDPALVGRTEGVMRLQRVLQLGLVAPTESVAAAATGRFLPVSARDTGEIPLPAIDRSVLVVRGPAGSGRSRMLQELTLRAALSGARVARIAARSAGDAPYALVRELVEQLLLEDPELGQSLSKTDFVELARLVGIEPTARAVPDDTTASGVQANLVDWLAEVAEPSGLVVAIDDLDDADIASIEAMSSLATRAASSRIVFAASVLEREESPNGNLDKLVQTATTIDLTPLSLDETIELIASLFGEVENCSAAGQWIHGLCAGNPEQSMQLATHMVQSKLAHYSAGRWALRGDFNAGDLPSNFRAAVTAALAHLSPDALALAQVLALYEEAPALETALALAPSDCRKPYEVLTELTTAGVLDDDGQRYKLAHPRLNVHLLSTLSPEARSDLHLHIARALASAAKSEVDSLRAAYHFVRGGDLPAAAKISSTAIMDATTVFAVGPRVVVTLEALLEYGTATDRATIRQYARYQLVRCCQRFDRTLQRHVDASLHELMEASGFSLAASYDSDLSTTERFARAFKELGLLHKTLPADRRGMHPVAAFGGVIATALNAIAGYSMLEDREALARVIDLIEPMRGVSVFGELTCMGARASLLLADRLPAAAATIFRQVAETLDDEVEKLRGGPPELLDGVLDWRLRSWVTCGYMATPGPPRDMLDIADRVESLGASLDAWRLRSAAYLAMADLPRHRAAQHRIETCERRHISMWETRPWYLVRRASLQMALRDTDGLRTSLTQLEQSVEAQPEYWIAVQAVGAAIQFIEGDVAGAFDRCQRTASDPRPATAYPRAMSSMVAAAALVSLERHAEAQALIEQIHESVRAASMVMTLASALAGQGHGEKAIELLEAVRGRLHVDRLGDRMETELIGGQAMLLLDDGQRFEQCMTRLDALIEQTGCPSMAVAQRRLRTFALSRT